MDHFLISCPSACDPMHYVKCVDSEVCLVVSSSKTCVVMVILFVFCVRRLLFFLASYCTTPACYFKTPKQPLMGWSIM